MKILLVEDSQSDARLEIEFLGESRTVDFDITRAERLHTAITILDRSRFDAVLLDLSFPHTEGVEAVARLSRRFPNMPIVVLTGADAADLAIQAIRAGAFSTLPKAEADASLLARVLHQAVERERVLEELRRKDQDLQAANASLAELVEKNADAILVLDKEGRILFANEAASRLFGRRLQDLLDVQFGLPGAGDIVTEVEIVRPASQEPGYAEARFVELIWKGTEGYLATLRDITERRRAEETLKTLNAELAEAKIGLERAVAYRTTELEAANAELEAFSYSVSHDLMAPLRSMAGFCQALKEDYGNALDEQAGDYIRRIVAASKRMAELIDDLLLLSRVSRRPLDRDTIDLSVLAGDVLADLKESGSGRDIDVAIAPELTAIGDRTLIRTVLENLLGNALKYSGERSKVRIEVGVVANGGSPAYFVRDNGAGFDMAYADKLFKPFQRLHLESEFAGTGIGLASVARIVQRHGGSVWAEGEPDKGATFFFTLGGEEGR